MRILITSDLHYNIARSRDAVHRLVDQVLSTPADALVLAGDTAGADLAIHRMALRLFEPFAGMRLLVPGNHCLWGHGREDSLDRYNRTLPALAADEGFTMLDHQPLVHGGIGLAGTIGWYDYSFAHAGLGIPTDFYQAKLSPGAAEYLGKKELLEAHRSQLTPEHMEMGIRWLDGTHVRLGMSDQQFAALLAGKLRSQLADLSSKARQIAVFMHHLPFSQLLPDTRVHDAPRRLAFAHAYMGAEVFGQVLLEFPKVRHVYCGHSHWPSRLTIGQLTAVAIGSTYIDKRLEVLEIP